MARLVTNSSDSDQRSACPEGLFEALNEGQVANVRRLIPYDEHGWAETSTPFFRTLVEGYRSGMYDSQAPRGSHGATSLHVAAAAAEWCWVRAQQIMEFLLEHTEPQRLGAALAVRDVFGRTPLDVAGSGRMRLLLRRAADGRLGETTSSRGGGSGGSGTRGGSGDEPALAGGTEPAGRGGSAAVEPVNELRALASRLAPSSPIGMRPEVRTLHPWLDLALCAKSQSVRELHACSLEVEPQL